MAVATSTVTVNKSWWDGKKFHAIGTIAVSASPDTYATGGLTTSFAVSLVKSSLAPTDVRVEGESGWLYRFAIGSTIANGLLKIFGQTPTSATVGTIPLDEHAAAAIEASISGDKIKFHAIFELR